MWKIVLLVLAAVIAIGSGEKLIGGFQDVDYNTDEGAMNALNFSVVQHNRASNDVYLSQVAEVIKVQRQVSGLAFHLDLWMSRLHFTELVKPRLQFTCTLRCDSSH